MRGAARSDAQTVTVAVQTSPDGLFARAEKRSAPGASGRSRSMLNEPLGPRVVALVATTRSPLWRMRTFQRMPLRFWSTSNSTSMRPSSGPALIFAVEAPVHEPARSTSSSPLAWAEGGARARAQRRGMGRIRGAVMRLRSPPWACPAMGHRSQ
jgi:hypothetical protein